MSDGASGGGLIRDVLSFVPIFRYERTTEFGKRRMFPKLHPATQDTTVFSRLAILYFATELSFGTVAIVLT